jgi:NADPH-dependent ferric siderophore reductase
MSTLPTTSARAPRPDRPQAVLQVRSREQISSHTVRLVVGGDTLDSFRTNDFTDKYAKIIFVDSSLGLTPPYDLAALRESLPPEQRPVTRTYTVRRVDEERKELTIDFVVHGDSGIAAPWAAGAAPGDLIALSGAGGGYRPSTDVDWHLFAGDESALPAISSALEALPSDARGVAYFETSDDRERLDLTPPDGIDIRWLHRPRPGSQPQILAGAIVNGPWLAGRVGIFTHGERESMKAVRAVVKPRLGEHDQLSLSGYWAYGRTEDVFQSEKRQPIGQIGD